MINNFKKLNKFVQILLLLIPGINWIVEIVLRWPQAVQKKTVGHIILAVLVTFGLGVIIGWIDMLCIAINNKLIAE